MKHALGYLSKDRKEESGGHFELSSRERAHAEQNILRSSSDAPSSAQPAFPTTDIRRLLAALRIEHANESQLTTIPTVDLRKKPLDSIPRSSNSAQELKYSPPDDGRTSTRTSGSIRGLFGDLSSAMNHFPKLFVDMLDPTER